MDKKLLANISGLIGTNQLDGLNPERIYFDRAIIHENYDPLYLVDDIALLHTKNPIQMLLNGDRYQVNTICLGPFDQSTIMKEKPPDVALVVGWHDDNNYSLNTKVSNHLLKVMVSLIDHTQCVSLYQHLYLNISEKTLCYESRGKDSCRVFLLSFKSKEKNLSLINRFFSIGGFWRATSVQEKPTSLPGRPSFLWRRLWCLSRHLH